MACFSDDFLYILTYKPEGYRQSLIDSLHRFYIYGAHLLLEASFVQCTHLLEQYYAVLLQTASAGFYRDMSRQLCFALAACYSGSDHGRGVAVAYVVLYYQHRSYTALL